jgi:hypothetical protein
VAVAEVAVLGDDHKPSVAGSPNSRPNDGPQPLPPSSGCATPWRNT